MAPVPVPAPSGRDWKLVFDDEFNGTAIDKTKWADVSSAEADAGHGNLGNQQLEWNSFDNVSVGNGELTIKAERENYTSASGNKYGWTSGLLTTSPSFSFQYGYIEERAKLPAEKGFWPAFWTWQQPGGNSWQETDVYEYYSDNHTKLYLTSHIGQGGSIIHTPPFDPSAGYHTYGADIQASGTTFYIDGVKVGTVPGAPTEPTNLITNLAVYSRIPPDAATMSAEKKVDYIRAYSYDDNAKAVTPQPGYDGTQPTPDPVPPPDVTPIPPPTPTPEPTPVPTMPVGDWQETPIHTKTFYGRNHNETFRGTDANERFIGNGGQDTFFGGRGGDTFVVNGGGDKVIEYAGQGIDKVILSTWSYTMPNNVENLTVDRDAGARVTGNWMDNIIIGDIGRDTIRGGFGEDKLTGGGGHDTFVFRKGEVAGDHVTDFRGNGTNAGDVLRFEGFGAGAKLVPTGDTWIVQYGDGSEAFTLLGVKSLSSGDVVFA